MPKVKIAVVEFGHSALTVNDFTKQHVVTAAIATTATAAVVTTATVTIATAAIATPLVCEGHKICFSRWRTHHIGLYLSGNAVVL